MESCGYGSDMDQIWMIFAPLFLQFVTVMHGDLASQRAPMATAQTNVIHLQILGEALCLVRLVNHGCHDVH